MKGILHGCRKKFKGYDTVIVQDLKIETDTIEFRKEVFYSESQKKSVQTAKNLADCIIEGKKAGRF